MILLSTASTRCTLASLQRILVLTFTNNSHYIERKYYFDVHPPIGKMMLALAGRVLGFDGVYKFTAIGESYPANNVPYIGMRLLPALCGAASTCHLLV